MSAAPANPAKTICKTCGQSFDLSEPHDCPGLLSANPPQVTDAARQEAMSLVENYGDDPKGLLVGAIAACLQRFAAIGAGGQAVAVKPLVWSEDRDDDGTEIHRTRGGEVNLPYAVYEDGFIKKPFGLSLNQLRIGSFDTVVEAKAAAQKDYERRILSALSQPHPADERVVEALRELATARDDWNDKQDEASFASLGAAIDRVVSIATEGR